MTRKKIAIGDLRLNCFYSFQQLLLVQGPVEIGAEEKKIKNFITTKFM